jgi:2-oxoglutarate ferredoxin oxidoreductase subunit alpha
MQENIGYAVMTETPCVIVDVQRAGPSTGQATKAAQGDLMQSRWGTHGDHESIVLAPYSAQESFELTVRGFDLSEKLRHPVVILSDEVVAHSRERVVLDSGTDWTVHRRPARLGDAPHGVADGDGYSRMPRFGDGHNLLITGSTHDDWGFRRTSDAKTHDALVRRLKSKIVDAQRILTDVVVEGPKRAEWGVVSFGCTSRSVEEAMSSEPGLLRSMRLRIVWPFPDSEVLSFAETVDRLLVPEMNLGQLVGEVSRASRGVVETVPLNKIGGGLMIEPAEILAAMKQS